MLKTLRRKRLRKPETRAEYAALVAAVEEGRKAVREGRVVPHRAVRQWLLSWGTDRERRPPARR